MADIAITIDGKRQAEAGAKRVTAALDKIEKQALTVQKLLKGIDMKVNIGKTKAFDDIERRIKRIHKLAGKEISLKVTLSKVGLKGNLAEIQKIVRGYTRVKPIELRAVLKLDKRTIRKQMREAKQVAVRELTMPVKTVGKRAVGVSAGDYGQRDLAWMRDDTHPFADMEKKDWKPEHSRAVPGTGGQYSRAEMDRLKRMTVSDEGWKWAGNRLDEFEDDLKKWWDRIDIDQNKKGAARLGKVHDQVNEMRSTYQDINVAEADAGGKRQYAEREKLIKQLEGYQKGWAGVEKKLKATTKTTSFMNSRFAKFSILMSGIAATLFVWQELQQLLRAVISVGTQWLNLLHSIESAHNLNAIQAQKFGDVAHEAMQKGFDTKTVSEAYNELRKRGLSNAAATEKMALTLELAKNPMIDMAEASKITARGYDSLANNILDANKALDRGTIGLWKRIKGTIGAAVATWFEKREPIFLQHLENLESWMDANQGRIEGFLDVSADLIAAIGYGLGPVVSLFGELLSMMHKAPWAAATAFFKMTHRAEAGATPEGFTFEEWVDFDQKAKLQGWSELEKRIKFAQHQLKYWNDELKTTKRTISTLETKSYTELFQAGEIDLSEIAEGKSTKIGDLEKDASKAEKRIKLLTIALEALNAQLEGDDGIISIKEQLKQWEKYYRAVGRMSGLHKQILEDDMREAVANARKVVGSTGARQLEIRMQLKIDKREAAGEMREMKQYFNAIGKLPTRMQGDKEIEKYHEMNVKFIEREVQAMEFLNAEEKKLLTAIKVRAAWSAKEAPKLRQHEEMMSETGIMSPYLQKRKEGMAKTERTKMIFQGVDPAQAEAKYQLDLLQIEKDGYAKRKEMHEAYWEATGILNMDYLETSFDMHNKTVEALVALYPEMEAEIRATYDRMKQDEFNRWMQPRLDAHREMFETIGIMSEEHYAMESVRTKQRIEYLKELLGVENEVVKAYERRLQLEQEATKLESQGAAKGWDDTQVRDGFKAGTNRIKILADDWQNVSKSVSDAWVDAAVDMEAAFKEGFFSVINLEFENLQDVAMNVLKNIQKLLNEVLWAIARAALIRSAGSMFGGTVGMQHGGWITEPIVGTGMKTGTTYTFGEKEPELVTPRSQMGGSGAKGGGSLAINVPVNVDGGGDTTGLEFRLRTEIEETVKTIVREEVR